MKAIALLFLCGLLLGCRTTGDSVRVTRDVSGFTNTLALAVWPTESELATLPHVVRTKRAALAELRRLYPEVKFSESCEYEGWFIFSTTPLDVPLRYHNGYAVEKNGKRYRAFGFW